MLKMTRQAPWSVDEPGSTANSEAAAQPPHPSTPLKPPTPPTPSTLPREIGGREGPDPTRFGDWELRGRCIDF